MPFQQLTKAQQEELSKDPAGGAVRSAGQGWWAGRLLPRPGFAGREGEQCLNDKAKIDAIVAMRDAGIKDDKVEGTPTFIINGTKVDQPPTWTALEPELKKAGG